ncbi:MAG TPA: CDP-alcohol phosphatidyltransferase family protein, partial [Candidatus Udaeobacter sp.]|nr:CDP-alcohol phosphatidyltransferase family protein [Candidatus Udaeobacter sp.]
MIEEHHGFDRVVILSDESANWRIAGLRQLDRLVLGLDEFTKAIGTANKIEIVVFWKPEIPLSERLLPKHQRITRVRLIEASGSVEPEARILATRLFVARNALSKFFSTTPPVKVEQPVVDLTGAWPQLFEQFERTCRSAARAEEEHWRFLAQPSDIIASEKQLLRHSGKSQDGMVAKFLNRPISRVITRFLLKLPITPNACTILTFALAPVAFVFLVRGDYIGFLAGTALFQLINILDGCDGEIARAKYLDSERGQRLDAFCDFVANLIFVLCLGIGLFRQPSVSANIRFVYLLEGLITFGIMAGGLGRFLMP